MRTVTLQIDLGARRVTLPDQILAGPLRHQAAVKGKRILALLAAAGSSAPAAASTALTRRSCPRSRTTSGRLRGHLIW